MLNLSLLIGSFIILHINIAATELPPISNIDSLGNMPLKEESVSPCNSCKNLAKSFLKAVDETTRRSFEGGDADWERQKLGNYENSEVRFIEIQEKLCNDVTTGKDQCYNLAELYEEELENWFYEKRAQKQDLFQFLCINQVKLCCPDNTYGPDCIPCPGGVKEPCGGHGKCKNGGTRQKPATCICDIGYTGKLCDKCKHGFYEDANGTSFSCKKCDKACKDHCRGPGPKNCEVCSDGYYFLQNEGCIIEDDSNNLTEGLSQGAEDLKIGLDNVITAATQAVHPEL